MKPRKSRKTIEKMSPWNWGVSIRHSAMEQFTDLSFGYVKSVCKIYVLLESNEDIVVSLWHFYLIILSFNRYFWRFWPYLESWTFFYWWTQNYPVTSEITQYFITTLIWTRKFKLLYLEFGKCYRDGWPLYESQIWRRFSWLWVLNNKINFVIFRGFS